jgi:xanthosine utilization system XapX-like protein
VERAVISITVLMMATGLIIAAMVMNQAQYFVAIVGLTGPWVGIVLSNWFNQMQTQQAAATAATIANTAANAINTANKSSGA